MILHNFVFIYYIKLLHFFKKTDATKTDRPISKITIIIPAYNEEQTIAKKIENIKQCCADITLPYEVLIGSDGSTDNTCKVTSRILKENKLNNWKLFKFDNKGKCQTINRLVNHSNGDIIITTDADINLLHDAFQIIITTFNSDSSVGCISSIPNYQSGIMVSQSLYWCYEHKIRDVESSAGLLIVSTGWLYAFTKNNFKEIPEGVMADDLWIPLSTLMQNFKSIHKKELKAKSEITDEKTEINRRRRVISGGIDTVKRLFPFIIKKPLLFFIVFSHKINRWLLPLWIFLLVCLSMLINTYFIVFYLGLLIVIAFLLKPKGLYSILYSIITPLLSLKRNLTSTDLSKWEHTRK